MILLQVWKVDKVLDSLSREDTQLKVLSVEGNHLLALPDDFDVQVYIYSQRSLSFLQPDLQSIALLGIARMVATKNHIPCSCSLLLLLDSQMGYTQVEYVDNPHGYNADDALRKDIKATFLCYRHPSSLARTSASVHSTSTGRQWARCCTGD